jgi:hypothetical protein
MGTNIITCIGHAAQVIPNQRIVAIHHCFINDSIKLNDVKRDLPTKKDPELELGMKHFFFCKIKQ